MKTPGKQKKIEYLILHESWDNSWVITIFCPILRIYTAYLNKNISIQN